MRAGLTGGRRAPKQPKRECVKLAIDAALLWQHRRFLIRRSSERDCEAAEYQFLRLLPVPPNGVGTASWHHSLHALAAQIKRSKLLDNGLILEMQLPLTSKRLDCMLTGHSSSGDPNAVLIELKQWTDAMSADEDKCVQVEYGAGLRVVAHPSYQAKYYADYLRDYRTVFYEDPVLPLRPCAWLHNFQRDPDSALLDAQKFADVLEQRFLPPATPMPLGRIWRAISDPGMAKSYWIA